MKKSIFFVLLCSSSAFAETSSLSLDTTTTVVSSCTLSVTENIMFGTYDPLNPQDLTGQGNVRLNCTKGISYLYVSAGQNPQKGKVPSSQHYAPCQRRLATESNPSSFIPYDILDFTRPTVVKTQDESACLSSSGGTNVNFTQAGAKDFPVKSVIYSNQQTNDVTPGSYMDTLRVTVSF